MNKINMLRGVWVSLSIAALTGGCASSYHAKRVTKGMPAVVGADVLVDASVWRESYSTNRLTLLRKESGVLSDVIVSGIVTRATASGAVVDDVVTVVAAVNYGRPYEVAEDRATTNAVVVFPPVSMPEQWMTNGVGDAAARIIAVVDQCFWTLDRWAPRRGWDKSPRVKVKKPATLSINPADLMLVFGENRAPVVVVGQARALCRRPNTMMRDTSLAIGTAVLTGILSGGTMISSSSRVFPWSVKILVIDSQTGEILFADHRTSDSGFSPDADDLRAQHAGAEWMIHGSRMFSKTEE